MSTEVRHNGEAMTYRFRTSDKWIGYALLASLIAWTFCLGAIVLHISGVGAAAADAIAIALSILTGAAWAAIILLIND